MLSIFCPHCGERDEVEFRYGGEAHIARPNPDSATDQEWAQYLHMRNNPKGWLRERWNHRDGCRQWFNVLRHTVTHEIAASYLDGRGPEYPA